jgi:hypothetical protein
MTVDKMTVDKMSVDKMTVDKMTVDKMMVDKMTVDKMSVDKMTVDKMPCCQISRMESLCVFIVASIDNPGQGHNFFALQGQSDCSKLEHFITEKITRFEKAFETFLK